jgi:hypothetical protein
MNYEHQLVRGSRLEAGGPKLVACYFVTIAGSR